MKTMKLNFKRKPINFLPVILGIGIIIYGWYNVYELAKGLKNAVANSYQNAQLNIIKIVALEIENYNLVKKVGQQHTTEGIHQVSEIIKNSLIKLNYGKSKDDFSNYGSIWFIPGDSKGTNMIFPTQNIKLNISNYFALKTNNKSAKHYKRLLTLLRKKAQGVGWYINDRNKSYSDKYVSKWEFILHDSGVTLVTFTPFNFNGQRWMIGISTLLPKLMEATDSYSYINKAIFQMLAITLLIIILLIVIHSFSLKIFKLNKKINTFKIKIDEIHREQQMSEVIESDYFKKIKEIADKL